MHDWGEDLTEDDQKVDLQQFRRHQRKFPWKLIKNLLVTILLAGLLYYLSKEIQRMQQPNPTPIDGIEVEVD